MKARKILSQHAESAKHVGKYPAELFRCFPSFFVSVPYCSALHRRSHGVQQEIQNKLPLTHRVGQLDATDSGKRTSDPCAQSLLLTGAPGCPTESATGSRQCNSLQCSLVHGSSRLDPTPLTKQDRRARGTRQQDSQDKQINKRIQGQTNLQMRREGGSHCGGCVCVCVMLGPAVLCNP